MWTFRDLALELGQKGGGGLVHQSILTFLAFHCNHIKLNSPKKGGGRRGAGWGQPPFDALARTLDVVTLFSPIHARISTRFRLHTFQSRFESTSIGGLNPILCDRKRVEILV